LDPDPYPDPYWPPSGSSVKNEYGSETLHIGRYLFTQGRGDGYRSVEPERRGEGQQITKLGRKYKNGLMYGGSKKLKLGNLPSINSLCAELEKMPLVTFWSKFLGDDVSSIAE
jgi:hypothetical protein